MSDDVLISLPNLYTLSRKHIEKIWKTPPSECSHINKEVKCQSNKRCPCANRHPVFVDKEHNLRYVRTLETLYEKAEQLGGVYKRYV